MTRTRQNVWELADKPWGETILWYARAVAEMQRRPIADSTSWRFFAAIHGFDAGYWSEIDYLAPDEELPSDDVQKKLWNQCQHATWYFLPWHRGYLQAFEDVLRDIIVKADGPKDWALPYWNYFKPDQSDLPAEFASPEWPDSNEPGMPSTNPLFVERRFGAIDMSRLDLNALREPAFTGDLRASAGFGGLDTGFNHGGGTFGGLEQQPHNRVHVDLGGQDPANPAIGGLMSYPESAGLDPIFWLHHANIDRLWETWREASVAHTDPTTKRWLAGPSGDKFVMPAPDGSSKSFAPREVADLAATGVEYDDLSRGDQVEPVVPERIPAFARPAAVGVGAMPKAKPGPSLIGANRGALKVRSDTPSHVALEDGVSNQLRTDVVTRSLGAGLAEAPIARVFLNLENVRGLSDTADFDVYVGVPEGEDPADHPELRAGSIAPFGLRTASRKDGDEAGQGLSFVLEITDQLTDVLPEDDKAGLHVRVVPTRDLGDDDELTIGRISIYRNLG